MDKAMVTIVFTCTSITAPILGVILGGVISQKLGGYNSFASQYLLIIIGLFCVCVALPVPFIDRVEYVAILIWLLLFFGGFIVPPLTGIVINSVPGKGKASANSISQLL